MVQKEIENIVNEFLEGKAFFLVEVQVKKGNVVNVFVDGDQGINIDECVKISRFIESNFDRDEEDYELRVSSPGIDRPFQLIRQYNKYLEREISILTNDERSIEGVLKSVTSDEIKLELKPGKKEKEIKTENILFAEIKEAKPVIRI
jgi:ribosome maturation factor RimP